MARGFSGLDESKSVFFDSKGRFSHYQLHFSLEDSNELSMVKVNYQNLTILVADDFSNFRSTVNRMLLDLGVMNVDMAASGEEIIERCANRAYDVILCDYNLGSGRNGQHVLEELRHKKYLALSSIFILVSAEASRNIVMSAYDSAPDDYLMKPITTQMLHTRLDRLLSQRLHMAKVYQALNEEDPHKAMDCLVDLSINEDRHSTAAQKMLGEMFLQYGEYKKAEKLYMRVLEVRELDWARLGLAKAKDAQGDHEQAGQWLERIIEENYLYLPAYDALSKNWTEREDTEKAQKVVQQSVDVSPMSILRQKNLAQLAADNNAFDVAVEAQRKVVKLGRLSCYGEAGDSLELIRILSNALENDYEFPISVIKEAFSNVEQGNSDYDTFVGERFAQLHYLKARLYAVRGRDEQARDSLVSGENLLQIEDSSIDTEVDHIRALLALNYDHKSDKLLERLMELYADDQEALEKLDEFLDEPASDANKALVAEVNREGIELYNQNQFDSALNCFDKAIKLFPKHIGLHLNVVQALIGKLKVDSNDEDALQRCRTALETISTSVDEDNSQYKRFIQLKTMVRNLAETADFNDTNYRAV